MLGKSKCHPFSYRSALLSVRSVGLIKCNHYQRVTGCARVGGPWAGALGDRAPDD